MVYCEQDMCESKLGKLMQAFRADRPSEWQMDEFIGMAEEMHKEIERLRQAEKDAARYRWLRDNAADMDIASPLVIMADECGCVIDEDDDFCGILFREALDSAIDEAMNGSNN